MATVGFYGGVVSYDRGTPEVGLHVTGKYRTKHGAHMLQACGRGSSHDLNPVNALDHQPSGESKGVPRSYETAPPP